MIKALRKLGTEGRYLNIVNAIYDKPIANIILNVKKLKAFPLNSRRKQGWQLSPLLFKIVLEFLGRAIRQTILFKIALKKIKYLVVNLTKNVNDFYKDSYKPLKKEIKEYYSRW
jgi:hypothetical protein